jgi:hypothetical protein
MNFDAEIFLEECPLYSVEQVSVSSLQLKNLLRLVTVLVIVLSI